MIKLKIKKIDCRNKWYDVVRATKLDNLPDFSKNIN